MATQLDVGAFRVGDWSVEPEQNRISRDGRSVQLEPRMMDLLVYLAERAGRVVSKAELVDAVWACQVVALSSLTRCVALLRRALGDDVGEPSYIRTVSKRGYCLIAPVEGLAPAPVRADALAGLSPFSLVVAGRTVDLPVGDTWLGRGAEATIRIDSPRVSRRHAVVRVDRARAWLEDLGSKNGTFLGGRRVQGPVELQDGDEIVVGATVLRFRAGAAEEPTETEASDDNRH